MRRRTKRGRAARRRAREARGSRRHVPVRIEWIEYTRDDGVILGWVGQLAELAELPDWASLDGATAIELNVAVRRLP